MVWGTCRRILSNHHDAEDAFQATFLILVRKAASIAPKEMVGNWLYGVAHQTALKARATVAKRKKRECQVTTMPEASATEHEIWCDLQPLLDQELSKLPDKYRMVILLCDLEGKTRNEAARQIGCPEGTVATWLARGRVLLAKRLARHGLAMSGGSLAAVLAQHASACVPPLVLTTTINNATRCAAGQEAMIPATVVGLVHGTIKAMYLTKLKTFMTVLLMLGTLAFGGGLLIHDTAAGQQAKEEKKTPEKEKTETQKGDGKQQPKSVDMAAVKAAWQERRNRIRSVRVTFTDEGTIYRAYYQMLFDGFPSQAKAKVPEQDVRKSHASTVTIRGDNFRHSYTGAHWSSITGKLEPLDYIAISTPETRSFFNHPKSGERPRLSRSNQLLDSDEGLITLIPLMLAIRSEQRFRQLAGFKPTGTMVAIEGRDCAEFVQGTKAYGNYENLYLDPQRDWAVRRLDVYKDGELNIRITVDSVAHPVVGWLPSGWSYVTQHNGAVLSSGRVTIGKYEINSEIPDSEFTPKYPPGTFVCDDSKGYGNETVSIIKQDGSPGVPLPLSARPTDEQLLKANGPLTPQQPKDDALVQANDPEMPPQPKDEPLVQGNDSRTWPYFVLAGLALVLGMIMLLWYRRRRVASGPA